MNNEIIKHCVSMEDSSLIDLQNNQKIKGYGIFIPHDIHEKRKENCKKAFDYYKRRVNFLENRVAFLESQLGIINEKKEFKNYIWVHFKSQDVFCPELKKQDLARLAYLATFADYNTNELVYKGISLEKKHLSKPMLIDPAVCCQWVKNIVDLKYVTATNCNMYINPRIFNRGSKKQRKGFNSMKLFIDGFCELYESIKPSDHYKIGFLLKLIPFINPILNCLSENITGTIVDHIGGISIDRLSSLAKCSYSQAYRIINDLLDILYGKDNKRVAVVIPMDYKSWDNKIVMLNPELLFGGGLEEYDKAKILFQNSVNKILQGVT